MMTFEPLESRQQFAATTPDPTFGNAGRQVLSDHNASASAVLVVGSSIYVAGHVEQAEGVFKFHENGQLDTAWGQDGFASVNAFGVKTITQLAYEPRTNSLWGAGSTTYGGTDGGVLVSEVGVARWDATGNSTIDYPNVKPQYQIYEARLTFKKLVVLPHNQAAVLFDRAVESVTPADANGVYGVTDTRDVVLMKLGTNGRRDATFGRRGTATVAAGKDVSRYAARSQTDTSDASAGQDVQARSDGSFRVINTRQKTTAVFSTREAGGVPTGETLDSTVYVNSFVVRADGRRADSTWLSWRAVRTVGVSQTRDEVADFKPLLVAADGDGVLVIGGRSPRATVVLKLNAAGRSPAVPLFPGMGPRTVTGVQRDAYGVVLASSLDTITELSPRLKINDAFADHGTATVDDVTGILGGYGLAATDSEGRVLIVGQTVSSTTGIPVMRRYAVTSTH